MIRDWPEHCSCECTAEHITDDIDEETGRYIIRCTDIDQYTADYDLHCPCVYLGDYFEQD